MQVTVSVEIAGSGAKNLVVAEIDRSEPASAATLGLTLAEAKALLCEVQQQLVRAQVAMLLEAHRTCRLCGARRWVKDHRRVCFKSLFGGGEVAVPRLKGCGCDGSQPGATTLTLEGMRNGVAPELE